MANIEIIGMWGMGDVIMSRACIRELMKSNTVYLVTHNTAAFLDLIDQGLRISQIRARPSIRESVVRQSSQILTITPAPPGTHRLAGVFRLRRHGNHAESIAPDLIPLPVADPPVDAVTEDGSAVTLTDHGVT